MKPNDHWKPVTLAKDAPENDNIPFVMTPHLRDAAAMCRLEIEAMKRHRVPEGLEVGEATQAEWDEAVRNFRV
jgi:hypothetical protein